jgi:hypothetical protein
MDTNTKKNENGYSREPTTLTGITTGKIKTNGKSLIQVSK